MKVFTTASDIQRALEAAKGVIGFVPTMGALHAGHLSLVERSKRESDVTVASIFVNPTQFNDPADLANYPRNAEADLKTLEQAGVDLVFVPSVEEMYPEPDMRVFDFGQLDKVMEGAHRPGHFNGVGLAVSRLFAIIKPDKAFFGEKDFQQLAIVRELIKKEKFEIEIVGCPIVRESDGLAMSSRNALLAPAQRAAAPNIYKALREEAGSARQGSVAGFKRDVARKIGADPLLEIEYVDVVDAATLQGINSWDEAESVRACVAVRTGNVRLIDNIDI